MLQQLMPKDPIIHLAFFEGIGVAQLATRYLQLNIVKTFSWEIDPFCNEILDHHFSDHIQHMGDFAQTDFPSFCQQLRQTYDPTHTSFSSPRLHLAKTIPDYVTNHQVQMASMDLFYHKRRRQNPTSEDYYQNTRSDP